MNRVIDSLCDLSAPAASVGDEENKREARNEDISTSVESSVPNQRNGRQLVVFTIATSKITTTSTFTSSLTAVCSSTTGFRVCT